jgi:hypothetical protein
LLELSVPFLVIALCLRATASEPGEASDAALPTADPKFGGEINLKAATSKRWWPPRVVPPKGAPSVLLIMTDDCGFGSPGTFCGVILTPALNRVALGATGGFIRQCGCRLTITAV